MTTNPGIHPDAKFDEYPLSAQIAITALSKHFYLTRSLKPYRIGNSEYFAVLARPTDEFAVYVNADRELLVLFADYDTFEIRTLEAFEYFYGVLEWARVDGSLRFLISADESIEGKISHYLNQNPEYPVIIPLTFSSLAADKKNAVLNATRRNYLLRDLFGYQNPLREETFFFGRSDVVNTIIDLAKSGQSSSLFGLRKSGKTSAIYALVRKAKTFGCTAVVIDCQNPAIHARKYDSLLAYVIQEARKAVGNNRLIGSLGSSLEEISEGFFREMRAILSQSKSSILIVFDEIENISPGTAASKHWRNDDDPIYFWQTLRSFIQSDDRGRLAICLVGTNPNLLEIPRINGVANPMYLFAQKRYMPSLSFEETRDMVLRLGHYMGMEFTTTMIAALQSEYGGHPFFTRQICSKAHQLLSTERPAQVSQALLKAAQDNFASQLISYLSEILAQLSDFYPDEFSLLKRFISGDRSDLVEFVRDAPDVIDHLIGYGIVERIGDDVDVKLQTVRIGLASALGGDSIASRWAEISARRNRIEDAIRTAIFHASKSMSSYEWRSVLERCLASKRFFDLASHEPSFLLSKKTCPLYLTDLLGLVKDAAILPYLSERRLGLVRAIDTVNKLRKDAHAKWVTDEEFDAVKEALSSLEDEFLFV